MDLCEPAPLLFARCVSVTHAGSHTSPSFAFEDDSQIGTCFDVTHQSGDRGVTGASPDVSCALPLSAEQTRGREPGVGRWKFFTPPPDEHVQEPLEHKSGRLEKSPCFTQVQNKASVCQMFVCMWWP